MVPTNSISEERSTNAAISRLTRDLDCLPASAGLDELFEVVNRHSLTHGDVAEFVRFDLDRYHRE